MGKGGPEKARSISLHTSELFWCADTEREERLL